jgi:hypothetical protein
VTASFTAVLFFSLELFSLERGPLLIVEQALAARPEG